MKDVAIAERKLNDPTFKHSLEYAKLVVDPRLVKGHMQNSDLKHRLEELQSLERELTDEMEKRAKRDKTSTHTSAYRSGGYDLKGYDFMDALRSQQDSAKAMLDYVSKFEKSVSSIKIADPEERRLFKAYSPTRARRDNNISLPLSPYSRR
jgi:hypothetical protein